MRRNRRDCRTAEPFEEPSRLRAGAGRRHPAAPLPRRTAPRSDAARCAGKQGQGGLHAAPRSVAPPEAAPGLRGRRPLGPATGDRCARPAARAACRNSNRWPKRPKRQGIIAMTKSNRFGTALTAASLIALQRRRLRRLRSNRVSASMFGGKANGRARACDPGAHRRWRPTISPTPSRSPSGGRADARRRRLPRAARQLLFRGRAASPRPKRPIKDCADDLRQPAAGRS